MVPPLATTAACLGPLPLDLEVLLRTPNSLRSHYVPPVGQPFLLAWGCWLGQQGA